MTTTTPSPATAVVEIPRTRRGSRRDVVLWAAIDVMTEVGYHGASVRDIADRAGVTTTSIYHYFGSKENLLREIMVASLTEVVGLTRTALERAPEDPSAQLAALVRAWIDFHTRRRSLARISAIELRSVEGEARAEVLGLRDEQELLFRGLVERGAALGVFRTEFPREATRAVLQMGRDVSGWYVPGGPLSAAEIAEQYVVLALDLLRSGMTDEEQTWN
ncbi:TetR/AcrR family transcriptional regulator [Nocardioides campestrisoli]|uniref:TetR/AcrR family transcriptional regulator n=1 Tax=Nocardioides campestrisoli TaxID=2736757 RepID=UPI00163DCEC6|nr:TetR/AcrR family transcriptional regulator [Nocardioides campestrisoli]